MHYYFDCFKKYATFSGRATRKEFWMFFLFNVIILMVLNAIDTVMGTAVPEAGFGLLSGIYYLVILLPSLAVAVRRLHDIGNSGWWILIGIIPLIGAIVLLVKYCTPSK